MCAPSARVCVLCVGACRERPHINEYQTASRQAARSQTFMFEMKDQVMHTRAPFGAINPEETRRGGMNECYTAIYRRHSSTSFGDKPLLGMELCWMYSAASILFVCTCVSEWVSACAGVCGPYAVTIFFSVRLKNKKILPICKILA